MVSLYTISNAQMTGIADAVRDMRHEKSAMTPAQIEAKIRASRLGIPISVSNHMQGGVWVKPADWPDIDALAEQIGEDEDCLYLTYDLRKTPGYGWIGLYATLTDTSAKWYADRGHVENGVFVSDERIEVASGAYLRHPLDDTYGEVQLWRITTDSHIATIGFAPNTETNAQNYQNNLQPCVQRAGALPRCTRWAGSVGTNYNYTCGGTMWLERDAMVPGKSAVVRDLSSCWYSCYSLQSLDLSDWDTTNWAVTTLSSCWQACYSLQSLDLSDWDTGNWAVTTLQSCWQYCYSLQSLDLSDWDTTNWAVTTLYSCWQYCYSLQSLDLSDWDTGNWAVNDNRSLTASCQSLKVLKLPAYTFASNQANNNYSPNLPNLEEFNGIIMAKSQIYSGALKLTPASLIAIIDRLPTVTSALKLTLGQINMLKLADADIAVATQKGWTVA